MEVSALISQKLRVVNPDYLSESISHETILTERLPIARAWCSVNGLKSLVQKADTVLKKYGNEL